MLNMVKIVVALSAVVTTAILPWINYSDEMTVWMFAVATSVATAFIVVHEVRRPKRSCPEVNTLAPPVEEPRGGIDINNLIVDEPVSPPLVPPVDGAAAKAKRSEAAKKAAATRKAKKEADAKAAAEAKAAVPPPPPKPKGEAETDHPATVIITTHKETVVRKRAGKKAA